MIFARMLGSSTFDIQVIEYSSEAASLSGRFLAFRNQVLIYTEDNQKDKEFYRLLVSRLVGDDVLISDVIPLGSRKNVIDACAAYRGKPEPRVFIIDSDIDIVNDSIRSEGDLYCLPVYCSENLVFDENSIVELSYQNCGTKPRGEMVSNLGFENRVISELNEVRNLFLHFALCRRVGLPFTLKNYGEFAACPQGSVVDQVKIEKEIELLKDRIIVNKGEDFYNEEIEKLRVRWPESAAVISTIVSGKDYLLPYVRRVVSSLSGSKCYDSFNSLKLRLVASCNLSQLDSLRQLIISKAMN